MSVFSLHLIVLWYAEMIVGDSSRSVSEQFFSVTIRYIIFSYKWLMLNVEIDSNIYDASHDFISGQQYCLIYWPLY